MTERLFTAFLLLSLLLMQTVSGLHRGSAVSLSLVSTDAHHTKHSNAIHQRFFAALEGSRHAHGLEDALTSADAANSTQTDGVRPTHPGDGSLAANLDSENACHLLDHLLQPPGATHPLNDCNAQAGPPAIGSANPPERISRFQQLGPPVRGPPPQLS